jgi:hypothetical protein
VLYLQDYPVDHLFTIEEFHDVITEAARTSQDKPVKQPLVHRTPEGTSRELPGGRGFLRVLPGGNAPSPGPAPATPPVAAVPGDTTPALRFDADGQADLFSWTAPKARPLPPPGTQLPLFPDSD